MTYLLTDCVESNCIYKILHFTENNINKKDINLTINKIKNRFYEEDFDGWIVEDVLEELHNIYDFIEFDYDGDLDV